MSTRSTLIAAATSLGVLAAGWQLGASGLANPAHDDTLGTDTTATTVDTTTGGSRASSDTTGTSADNTGGTTGTTSQAGTSRSSGTSRSRTATQASTAPATTAAAPTTTEAAPADTTTAGTSASTASSGGGKLKDGTYTGENVSYEYGGIAVTVTVQGGKIVDAQASVSVLGGGHSRRIQQEAIPMLRDEVLEAQAGQIATIGGATYTSEAYATSLQSALDQA